jgi:ABC-type multidrug transport system ATPase subunit
LNDSNPTLAISVQDISKRYNREWIFKKLTYTFHAGKTYAVTGPNGSGKSTLLQVLWGQVPQSSGTIRYTKGTKTIPLEEVFRCVAIATPYMDLIDEFTLDEMLNFHFRLKRLRPGVTLAELPRLMYLEDAQDKQLINFSSGMKQRLTLAMAFYTDADVYFLDEPGTNLDSTAFAWYQRELAKLPEKAIILIASNDPDEYPKQASIVHIMDFKR